MNKRRVLEIFAAGARFMTPDDVRKCLLNNPQRSSVYSYLDKNSWNRRKDGIGLLTGLHRVEWRG
jgi:hypothetical protein